METRTLLRTHKPVAFYEEGETSFNIPGPGYWAVTRHADVVHASLHPEIFSSEGGITTNDLPPGSGDVFGSMIVLDDPRHKRLRGLVSQAFSPHQLRKVNEHVESTARRVVNGVIERGACDFVTDVAAARELFQLMDDLRRQRLAQPTDDLTSALVHAEVEGDRLTVDELGSFFVLLTAAGNETTRNAISHGVRLLCEHPDQRALWTSDFEAYAKTAIEEIVRYASPVVYMRRTTTRATELGGQPLDEGAKVILYYASADRDPAVFDDPDTFDIARQKNEHVGFGVGPHFCLGANLARREMTVMFRELFRRMPELQITGEPERLLTNFLNAIKHLPCEFIPGPVVN